MGISVTQLLYLRLRERHRRGNENIVKSRRIGKSDKVVPSRNTREAPRIPQQYGYLSKAWMRWIQQACWIGGDLPNSHPYTNTYKQLYSFLGMSPLKINQVFSSKIIIIQATLSKFSRLDLCRGSWIREGALWRHKCGWREEREEIDGEVLF